MCLFWKHKWKVMNAQTLEYSSEFSNGMGTRFILQCQICGDVKKRDLT